MHSDLLSRMSYEDFISMVVGLQQLSKHPLHSTTYLESNRHGSGDCKTNRANHESLTRKITEASEQVRRLQKLTATRGSGSACRKKWKRRLIHLAAAQNRLGALMKKVNYATSLVAGSLLCSGSHATQPKENAPTRPFAHLLHLIAASALEPGVRSAYTLGVRAGLGLEQPFDDYWKLRKPVDEDGLEAWQIVYAALLAGIPVPTARIREVRQLLAERESEDDCYIRGANLDYVVRLLDVHSGKLPDLAGGLWAALEGIPGDDDVICMAVAQQISGVSVLQEAVNQLMAPENTRHERPGWPVNLGPSAPHLDALAGIHRSLGWLQPGWLRSWIKCLKDPEQVNGLVGQLLLGELWIGRTRRTGRGKPPPPSKTLEYTLFWMANSPIRLETMGRFLGTCVAHGHLTEAQVDRHRGGFYGPWRVSEFGIEDINDSLCRGSTCLSGITRFRRYDNPRAYRQFYEYCSTATPFNYSKFWKNKVNFHWGYVDWTRRVAEMIESGQVDASEPKVYAIARRLIKAGGCTTDNVQTLLTLGIAQGRRFRPYMRHSAQIPYRQSTQPRHTTSHLMANSGVRCPDLPSSFWLQSAELLDKVALRLEKLNHQLPAALKQNPTRFVAEKESYILSLIWILGIDEAHRHMDYYLSLPTFHPLECFLNLQPKAQPAELDLLRGLYPKLSVRGRKRSQGKAPAVRSEHWYRILRLHQAFVALDASTHFVGEIEQQLVEEPTTLRLDAIEKRLSSCLLAAFCQHLDLSKVNSEPKVSSNDEQFTRRTLAIADQLPLLIQGRTFLRSEHRGHCWFFDAIALRMISGAPPSAIRSFLTDTTQNDPVGQHIAEHNAEVRLAMKHHGLDPELYWRGIRPRQFDNPVDPFATEVSTLWAQLSTLIPLLDGYQKVHSTQEDPLARRLTGLGNLFGKMFCALGLNEVERSAKILPRQMLKRLGRPETVAILAKQLSKARAVAEKINGVSIVGGPSLVETLRRIMASVAKLQALSIDSTSGSATGAAQGPFVVRVWDRNPLHSLTIGKAVGCCLAPDGTEFQGLIERYIDAAMNVVEVVNKNGTAVALAWIFLAEDKKGDLGPTKKGSDLVINFLEMESNTRRSSGALRDLILRELISYTAALAKHVGAKRLLARSQSYGGLPDHEAPLVKVALQKIGGTCIEAEYYLIAESESELYLLWERPSPPATSPTTQNPECKLCLPP